MFNASKTSFPRTVSATRRIFRGEVGQLLSFAIAMFFIASLRSSAFNLLRDPIILNVYELNASCLFYLRDHGKYELVKTHQACVLPCSQLRIQE